jgi:hypothetical protein
MERFIITSHRFQETIDAIDLESAIDEFEANNPMEEIVKTEQLTFESKKDE